MSLHDLPTDKDCLNCRTALLGPYCHVCGQDKRAAEPSLRELGLDFIEMMTHADSKLWRTVSRLFLEPARLTHDYISGRRASEIPPVRMFFVALLLFFSLTSVTPFHKYISGQEGATEATQAGHVETLKDEIRHLHFGRSKAVQDWTRAHLLAAIDEPDEVQHVMGEWAERLLLLLLPISAVALWGLYALPRPLPLYHHLIFSLHSLTVFFLVLTVSGLLAHLFSEAVMHWVNLALVFVLAVHLFRHLRGYYERSVFGTVLRMVLLAGIILAAVIALSFCLAVIGLQFGATGA